MLAYGIYWILMPLVVAIGAIALAYYEAKQSRKNTDVRLAAIAHELKRRATPAE